MDEEKLDGCAWRICIMCLEKIEYRVLRGTDLPGLNRLNTVHGGEETKYYEAFHSIHLTHLHNVFVGVV